METSSFTKFVCIVCSEREGAVEGYVEFSIILLFQTVGHDWPFCPRGREGGREGGRERERERECICVCFSSHYYLYCEINS